MSGAGLEHSVEKDFIREYFNARLVEQGHRTCDVAAVTSLLQGLHHDRDGVVVHLHSALLHHLDGLPGQGKVSVAGADGRIDEAVVGDVIRRMPGSLHLKKQCLALRELSLLTIPLEQSVVGNNVDQFQCFHLRHQILGTLDVPCRDADVEDAVEGSDVDVNAAGSQPLQDLEGSLHVLVSASSPNQRHVVLDVQGRSRLGQVLGELRSAALHSELHEAAVHDCIGLKPVLANLVIEIASFVVHVAVRVDLHERTVSGNRHRTRSPTILHDFLSEFEELYLGASRQKSHAQTLGNPSSRRGLHLLEEIHGSGVCGHGVELEQGVIGACREHDLLASCRLFDSLREQEVVALHAILEQLGCGLRRERRHRGDRFEDLAAAGGFAGDADELRHGEGRDLEPKVLHFPELLHDSIHLSVLQEALDAEREASGRQGCTALLHVLHHLRDHGLIACSGIATQHHFEHGAGRMNTEFLAQLPQKLGHGVDASSSGQDVQGHDGRAGVRHRARMSSDVAHEVGDKTLGLLLDHGLHHDAQQLGRCRDLGLRGMPNT
mmetsp:Transcript_78572/g.163245  ORF Transcript_78572/g.163245 Transcript_78572/m.163245 type:complete len:549 (-) Transcript_78572:470-2116(-)